MGYTGRLGEIPAEKERYIEFIGDSITCGLGSLCGYLSSDGLTINSEQTSTSTGNKCGVSDAEPSLCEDATNSYAYLAAETLDADYSFVSYSGIGVTRTWNNDPMSQYYKYASKSRNAEAEYDFTKKPDLVVINLGTNDAFGEVATKATAEEYKTGVKDLIKLVRDSYGPNVKILWATGLMGDAYKDLTAQAINGLENIYHFTELPEGRDGHNGHPTKDQAAKAAQELVAYINDNIF